MAKKSPKKPSTPPQSTTTTKKKTVKKAAEPVGVDIRSFFSVNSGSSNNNSIFQKTAQEIKEEQDKQDAKMKLSFDSSEEGEKDKKSVKNSKPAASTKKSAATKSKTTTKKKVIKKVETSSESESESESESSSEDEKPKKETVAKKSKPSPSSKKTVETSSESESESSEDEKPKKKTVVKKSTTATTPSPSSKQTVEISESESSEDEKSKKKVVVKKSTAPSPSSKQKVVPITKSPIETKNKVSNKIDLSSQEHQSSSSSSEEDIIPTPPTKKIAPAQKKTGLRKLKKEQSEESPSSSDFSSSEDEKEKNKTKNLKRKVKPESSSSSSEEDTKQKEKKIKLKSPILKAQSTIKVPYSPPQPPQSPIKVPYSPTSQKQQLLLSPNIKKESKIKHEEKENNNPLESPHKSTSTSKSTPDKKKPQLQFAEQVTIPIIPTPPTTTTTKTTKISESPFDMEVDEKPSKNTTPIKSTSSSSSSTPPVKNNNEFDDDLIFNSPEIKTKTPTKPTSTKTTKQSPSSKFDSNSLFEEDDTPLNRAIEKSIVTRSLSLLGNDNGNSIKVTKKEPFEDDSDGTSEETEDEGEDPIYKQPSFVRTPSTLTTPSTPTKKTTISTPPATPTKSTSKKEPATPTGKNTAWRQFLQGRPTPANKGSKPLPRGKENCLAGKVFLVSGVLDSFEREEANDLILRWGGTVAKSAVKKLNFLVAGLDVGVKKLEGAKKVRAKIISEDDLLEMINKTLPKPIEQPVVQQPQEEEQQQQEQMDDDVIFEDIEEVDQSSSTNTPPTTPPTTTATTTSPTISSITRTPSVGIKGPSLPVKNNQMKPSLPIKPTSKPAIPSILSQPVRQPVIPRPTSVQSQQPVQLISMAEVTVPKSMLSIEKGHSNLWVEKYKPKTVQDLVGNPGAFEQFSKWFDQWNGPRDANKKNAVLLSGAPGIGKTSAALIMCKLKGFEPIELNASDTRSKSEIERLLNGVSDNQNITKFFSGSNASETAANKKLRSAIILDEIDGSSGNSDRGGIAEIISLIKKSKMPFICLCNDYYSPKVKSLKNHCLDLKLNKPSAGQVTSRLLGIAKHEGMRISSYMMNKVYAASHSDIRQSINTLQMMSRSGKDYNNDNISQGMEEKDFDLSPFTAAELMFRENNSNINKKLDYFFSDFSLIPLLVQENYLKTRPNALVATSKTVRSGDGNSITKNSAGQNFTECELFSMAADAISDSDQFGRAIGKEMAWNLLPTYGVTSSIIPTCFIGGSPPMPLAFPSFLGKYSNATKQQRFVRELQLHMRSTGNAFANRDETRLYYVPMLKHHLIQPLVQDGNDGVEHVIEVMDKYGLTEDDRNNIIELSSWTDITEEKSGAVTKTLQDPTKDIKSTVKAAFTRKFRGSSGHAIYDFTSLTSKGSGGTSIAEGYEEVEGEKSEKQEIDDELTDDENKKDGKDSISNLIKKSNVKSKSSRSPKSKSSDSTTTTTVKKPRAKSAKSTSKK